MKRSGGSTQKKKILIVEDEQPLRKALVQVLRRDGYAILEAGDGNDGLKKALQHHPHLVLLDILLPEMDGISMLKLLREDAWGAKVPVIVLTNLADAAHERDALEEKITEFLVKTDWTLRDLASKIRKHLES